MCFYTSVVFIYIIYSIYFNGYSEALTTNITEKFRHETNCNNANDFQCNSGICINDDLLCDGKADCDDNSDETADACSKTWCLKTTYRCKYGACVHFSAACNGIKECFDGSDEMFCSEERLELPPQNSCRVPEYPENGIYINGFRNYKPNSFVSENNPLYTECNFGYKLTFPEIKGSICFNGSWIPHPSTCSRACKPPQSTDITSIVCMLRGELLHSCEDSIEETQAFIRCAEGYEESSLIEHPSRVCQDGSWNGSFPNCYPVCGRKQWQEQIEEDGQVIRKGMHPWHVGIYNLINGSYLCSGTIIGERVVLTAATCLKKLSDVDESEKKYFIAVGKFCRDYNDTRDNIAQYYAIEDVHRPNQYQVEPNNQEADIALITLRRKIRFFNNVQPVCFDWTYEWQIPQMNISTAVETSWDGSNELMERNISLLSFQECSSRVAGNFKNDTFCTEFSKNDLCPEDIGSGIVYQNTNGTYYLGGIASKSCVTSEGIGQFRIYTWISKYVDFIQNITNGF